MGVGINGCASVIGAVLGKMISMSIGLRMTMLVAALLYVSAALVSASRCENRGKAGKRSGAK